MASITSRIAALIERLVDKKVEKALRSLEQTTRAEVVGTDSQGKTWVVMAGSDERTPVKTSAVEVSPGDAVTVKVGKGRAVIDRNLTDPSASKSSVVETQATANAAMDRAGVAGKAAADAQTSADTAAEQAAIANLNANNAIISADAAAKAASQAADSAVAAADSAQTAEDQAGIALAQAQDATRSSASALAGLAQVQDVVGVLDWMAHKCSFVLTEDATVDLQKVYYDRSYVKTSDSISLDGKAYFERSGDTYAQVTLSPNDDPSDMGLYELHYDPQVLGATYVYDSYFPTEDTAVDPEKQYYTAGHAEYDPDPWTYTATSDAYVEEGKQYWQLVDGAYEPASPDPYAYALTADTTVVSGKAYYALEEGVYVEATPEAQSYVPTEDVAVASGKTYYELVTTYSPTQDTAPQEGKQYWRRVQEYGLTDDETVDPDKTYYVLVDGSYVAVEDPVDADIATYYELLGWGYEEAADPDDLTGLYESTTSYQAATPTDDELEGCYELVANDPSEMGLYERSRASASGLYERTATDPSELGLYERTQETAPTDPHAIGLYELTNVEEAVRDYLMAHLAVTESGLWVMESQGGGRLLVSPSGVDVYAIDSKGQQGLVASYGATATVGRQDGAHITVTDQGIKFYDAKNEEVAYIQTDDGVSTFYMTHAIVVKALQFGKWRFMSRSNNNLMLKWVG